ncbi:Ty1/Copia family ribonuclease HI [Aspergillus affinis]|uniref:Ty1/Copia family ribonuclease HI n=1 Tax=Aspergillus affinis TaxID=1070780 RepID=UPI0022FF320C|nr:uncharacterized protein KD926_003519 [Aspergillus affinis]KAI9035423.1 hypothetical protein KD926_003519 [Aspergillus affinis]
MTLYSGKASPRQIQEFQEKVGSILWSTVITRPDIAKSASELLRFLVNPGPDYLAAANRVIQFLYGTRFYGIRYSKSGDPNAGEVFIMASNATFGDHTDRKSSKDLVCLLYGGPVDWHAGKQKTVLTSTTEAELLAISKAGKNVFWWKHLFNVLQFNLQHKISIKCDNRQTVRILQSEDSSLPIRLRHIDIHQYWFRQEVQNGQIAVEWVATANMPADGLTKILPIQKYRNFMKMLNLHEFIDKEDPYTSA